MKLLRSTRNDMYLIMPEPRRSKRFRPNAVTEKIVPVILIILLLILATVLIITLFSLIR